MPDMWTGQAAYFPVRGGNIVRMRQPSSYFYEVIFGFSRELVIFLQGIVGGLSIRPIFLRNADSLISTAKSHGKENNIR
jgi:hypothetical protein